MKSLITYFSLTGNAEKVANVFATVLKEKGEVTIQRLIPKNPIKNFLLQCRAARNNERTELSGEIINNPDPYDLIIIGSPLWAFKPTPAINTFLDQVTDFKGKTIIMVLTSGCKLWVSNYFQNLENLLKNKNPGKILRLNILDSQIKNVAAITTAINTILTKL